MRTFALRSLERVAASTCYKPGRGVAHCFEGTRRCAGLLADQFAMAAARLDAFDVTGNIVYEMMAEELARYAVMRRCGTNVRGGFFDRALPTRDDAIGLLRHPLKPFVANCEAARMLRRLAAVSGDDEFAGLAERTLRAVAARRRQQGPLAAHYVLAVRAAGSGDRLSVSSAHFATCP